MPTNRLVHRGDDVVQAALDYGAVAGDPDPGPAYDWRVRAAGQQFRFALRARFYREVALGLPGDAVVVLMLTAIRLGLADALPLPVTLHVHSLAESTLGAAVRGLRSPEP
jgi:hypothetical protein